MNISSIYITGFYLKTIYKYWGPLCSALHLVVQVGQTGVLRCKTLLVLMRAINNRHVRNLVWPPEQSLGTKNQNSVPRLCLDQFHVPIYGAQSLLIGGFFWVCQVYIFLFVYSLGLQLLVVAYSILCTSPQFGSNEKQHLMLNCK